MSAAPTSKKGELLKDILAMANGFRSSDAFVLIGVAEVKGGRADVIGCDEHPDDASFQQFVNSKTNKPVHFNYRVEIVGDKKIGVFHIPQQERPLYAVKRCGRVDPNVVYYRQSTTTAPATPDIIALMGRKDAETNSLSRQPIPRLQLTTVDVKTNAPLDVPIPLLSQHAQFRANELPDYSSGGNVFTNPMENISYWRQIGEFIQAGFLLRPFTFVVENRGDAAASNVILEVIIDTPLIATSSQDMPRYRSTSRMDDLGNLRTIHGPPDFDETKTARGSAFKVQIPLI